MTRILFLLLFFLKFVLSAQSQTVIYTGAHYGRMLKINTLWPEITHNASIVEWGFSQRVSGKKEWHHRYHFPETGLRFMFFFPGNTEVFGHGFSLTPTLSFLLKESGSFQLRFTYCYSLGIVTKPYHRQTNPGNNVMGSPINNFILLQLESRWQLSERWQTGIGMGYSHFSNARTKVPNLGINIPAISVKAGYTLKEKSLPVSVESLPDAKKLGRLQPGISLGYGVNSQKSPGGPLYPVYAGSFSLNTIWNNKIRLSAGTKWFYAESLQAFIQNQDIPFEKPAQAATGGIIYAGGEFLFGHWAIVAHLGPYIKKPYQMNYLLYTRFGTQWYLSDQQVKPYFQPYIGLYVHAHSGEADFADFSVGFVF
ncbi:MAG: acyloxyacyl hydrolase [Bacteroidia bacterium]